MVSESRLMEPVGSIEIAIFLGVKPDTIVQWRRRPQIGFPAPRWTVSGRPAWAWIDIIGWSVRSGRLVGVVNTEDEAKALIGTALPTATAGKYIPIVGYRPASNGTFLLTSVPQDALDVEEHPMNGAWKLSCGRWLMPDQLPGLDRRPGVRVRAPSCDHDDELEDEWPAL